METLRAVWGQVVARRRLLALVVLVALVATPFMLSALQDREIRREGEIGAAEVTRFEVRGSSEEPEYWITYRLPAQYEDDTERSVEVTEGAYKRADLRDAIRVQVSTEDPGDHHVEGAVDSDLLGWLTIAAEFALLGGFGWMLWSVRRRQQVSHRAGAHTHRTKDDSP